MLSLCYSRKRYLLGFLPTGQARREAVKAQRLQQPSINFAHCLGFNFDYLPASQNVIGPVLAKDV